ANYILGSVGIPDDTGERFLDLTQIWRVHLQKTHAPTSVVPCRGARVKDFMSQRGRQFSHHANTIQMSEIRFQLPKTIMFVLRAFAFSDINVRSDHLNKISVRRE